MTLSDCSYRRLRRLLKLAEQAVGPNSDSASLIRRAIAAKQARDAAGKAGKEKKRQ